MDGCLLTFSHRYRDLASAEVLALLPYSRFVTGRIPSVKDYPMPYACMMPGAGFLHHRSDRSEIVRRQLSVHVWVDPYKLEDGEVICEELRRIYANRAWYYEQGQVFDVLDGGPQHVHQINEPTFQCWELVKLFTLCILQPRLDLNDPPDCFGTSGQSDTSGQ